MKIFQSFLFLAAVGFAAANDVIIEMETIAPEAAVEPGDAAGILALVAQHIGPGVTVNPGRRRLDEASRKLNTAYIEDYDLVIPEAVACAFNPIYCGGGDLTVPLQVNVEVNTEVQCTDYPYLNDHNSDGDCLYTQFRFGGQLVADASAWSVVYNTFVEPSMKPALETYLKNKYETATVSMSINTNDESLVVASGDPHFKTLGGKWFDYMGACDLKMIHAPKFDGETPLDVNVRTKIRYDYSYIESAVLKLGNDTLEVASFGDYFLNGVAGAQMPAFVGGYPVTHSSPSKKIHKFTIDLNTKETIVLKNFKDMVSVSLEVHNSRFAGALGMGAAMMLGRDGKTEFEDPNAYADEWQIRADEPMLFATVKGPQAPEKCVLPSATQAKGRRLGETIALEAAEKVCAKWAADNKDNCVHDVMATGDLELAAAGAF